MAVAPRLGRTDLEKLARLARLELRDDELDTFTAQLAAVTDHVARLQSVDTTSVPAASEAMVLHAPLREDEVRPSLGHDAALESAPESAAGAFVVPRILSSGRGGSGA